MTAKRTFNLTKQSVAKLKPPESGREYWYDARTPNLAVCVTASGQKTYYRCGRVYGRGVRVRIGATDEITVENARKACVDLNGQIAAGKDPHEIRVSRRNELTLGELFDWYMENHARPHKKEWRKDQRRFDRYLGHWRKRRLSSITRAQVKELHVSVRESKRGRDRGGPYAANHVLELLRHLYAKAKSELNWRGENPAEKIQRFPQPSRKRYLLPNELGMFLIAVQRLKRQTTRDFILVSLFCGARRGNTQAMQWRHINFEHGLWHVPANESKNGEAITVVLPPAALEILRTRYAARTSSRWVFPGQSRSGHLTSPKAAWKKVLEMAEIDDLRIHDLRRTLGSWQAANGASLSVIGKSLTHKSLSATQVYAHLDLQPVRESVHAAVQAMLASQRPEK